MTKKLFSFVLHISGAIHDTFLIYGRRGGLKMQKMTHNYQFQSVTLYISRTVDHMIKIFGKQV